MKVLSSTMVLEALCAATQKWGMYINISTPDDSSADVAACSFLNFEDHAQIIMDQQGWFLFNAKETMESAYDQCVGDDGPTHLNPYNGSTRVYALTCDPTGQLLTENT